LYRRIRLCSTDEYLVGECQNSLDHWAQTFIRSGLVRPSLDQSILVQKLQKFIRRSGELM
jgi:hypothetical protein